MNERGVSTVPMFLVLCFGAVAIVITAVTLLFGMQITGEIVNLLSWIEGPGGITPDAIQVDAAFMMFASAGLLSIPASIVLMLLVGGDGREQQAPQQPGGGMPPF